MKFLDESGLSYFFKKIKLLLGDKVDKEDGKVLSSNDYTTAEKEKLAGLKNVEISDSLDVEDKTVVAPSIRLAEAISGVPTEGILAFEGTETDVPDGYEVVSNPSIPYYDIYNAIYPIGRGFIDFTDTDYSNYLGFDWERELVGMTPIGKDENDTDFSTVGQIGGEKEHTLTVNELPSYNLPLVGTVARSTSVQQGGNYTGSTQQFLMIGQSLNNLNSSEMDNSAAFMDYSKVEGVPSVIAKSNGGGQAYNNMQPYQVVAYWKRIA